MMVIAINQKKTSDSKKTENTCNIFPDAYNYFFSHLYQIKYYSKQVFLKSFLWYKHILTDHLLFYLQLHVWPSQSYSWLQTSLW